MLATEPTPPPPPVSLGWIEAALVICFVVFLAIVARVVLSRSSRYRDVARIPLEDDVVTPREGADEADGGGEDTERDSRNGAEP